MPRGSQEGRCVGFRFVKVASADQAAIDRFVFSLMRRKARARRPLDGGKGERRLAPRVEIADGDGIQAEVLPPSPSGVVSRLRQEEPQEPLLTLAVHDMSTTGCALDYPSDVELPRPREQLTIRLRGREIDVQLQARVIHVQRESVASTPK